MPVLIEGAGVPLACEERGEGAPVLLVHDIAADAAGLAPLGRALAAAGARAIAYDRRGYGASGAPRPYLRTTVEEQAEDAAALLDALDAAPAVLAGADLGAVVALDLLRRHRDLVRAAVLIDPPLLQFVPDAAEVLSAERIALEEAVRTGGPAEAVAAHLAARGAAPERIARARAHAGAFFADYGAAAGWPVTRADLRALDAPVAVLTGPATPAHVRAAADALATLLPAARREEAADPVPGLRAMLQG